MEAGGEQFYLSEFIRLHLSPDTDTGATSSSTALASSLMVGAVHGSSSLSLSQAQCDLPLSPVPSFYRLAMSDFWEQKV